MSKEKRLELQNNRGILVNEKGFPSEAKSVEGNKKQLYLKKSFRMTRRDIKAK
jgi:hypothetical protein